MSGLAARRAVKYARRAWPVVLAAYRRWEKLPPEEKERYLRTARQTVERGRDRISKGPRPRRKKR